MEEILEQLEDDSNDIKDFMLNSVGKFLKNIRLWKLKGANINESNITVIDKKNLQSEMIHVHVEVERNIRIAALRLGM